MTHPESAGLRHWSTSAVPPRQRLDYWVGAISEGFLAMVASPDKPSFNGELVSAPMGPVGVNLVRADAQKVWRTVGDISRNPDRYCYLLGNLDSAWRVSQDGREALMRPGDFVLVDARRPYHFAFDQGASTVSLELPLDWLTRWVAEPEAHVAQPFRRDHPGWGCALAAFAMPWRPELAVTPPLQPQLLTDQLGALLALACTRMNEAAPQPSLHERVLDVIRQRLAEPGLTATDVATSLNVSVRSLHRAMAASHQTFAQALMAQRMNVARQMLSNHRLRQVSVAEIGRRVGLLDPSHFSRLCRHWLGQNPKALRGQ